MKKGDIPRFLQRLHQQKLRRETGDVPFFEER